MRNLLIFCILAGIGSNLFAQQQPTFNIARDYGYLLYTFEDMVVADDTIVGIGSAYPDSFNLTQGIVLTQLDSNGVLLKTRMYFDSFGRNMAVPTDGRRIIKTSDGGYAFVVSSIPDNDAFLYKVDRNFDIEFRKTYSDSVYTSNFRYRILETPTGYLLSGFNQTTNFQYFSFIRSVDNLGNINWEKKYFHNGEDNYILDIKPINDSVFAVASAVILDASQYKLYSVIRFIDIHGTQLSYWESEIDDEIGIIMEIIPDDNGSLIMYGQNKYIWNQFNKLVQQSFVKLKSSFEVDWIRHWYKPATENSQRTVREFIRAIDGNIIGVGNGRATIQGSGYYAANIIKFSPDGDSIWNRSITAPPPAFKPGAECRIDAGGILSSGSIIAGGTARGEDGTYYAWVIKITNDGCLDTLFSCTTPVREHSLQEELGILPNPVDDFVVLKFTPSSSIQYLTISDLQGRQVFQTVVADQTGDMEIYTGGFQNGLYFINIAGDGRRYSGKLSILHR